MSTKQGRKYLAYLAALAATTGTAVAAAPVAVAATGPVDVAKVKIAHLEQVSVGDQHVAGGFLECQADWPQCAPRLDDQLA
ncbi:hypothetical protein AB0I60_01205 [Actinosynnema sp. NPDC050436]|uniref:hypothetical protein n=1 Tax=Actinosynnema sp. NPDC050436 TaxID=3155659 RepID=UPI0033E24277